MTEGAFINGALIGISENRQILVFGVFFWGHWGRDRAGWILPGESSTTAAPILETVDFCVENWRSAEVGYSGLDIQVKPALVHAASCACVRPDQSTTNLNMQI